MYNVQNEKNVTQLLLRFSVTSAYRKSHPTRFLLLSGDGFFTGFGVDVVLILVVDSPRKDTTPLTICRVFSEYFNGEYDDQCVKID